MPIIFIVIDFAAEIFSVNIGCHRCIPVRIFLEPVSAHRRAGSPLSSTSLFYLQLYSYRSTKINYKSEH